MSNASMQMKLLLDTIIETIGKRDAYYDESPLLPEPGPPASADELAELEKYWNVDLPPCYRECLACYNGISRFYFDVPLLSTRQIIADTQDVTTFREFFPDVYRFIFACGTESYDAFCFDFSRIDDRGEATVLQLGDRGIEEEWASFGDFLSEYLQQVQEELARERADREALEP